MTASQNSDIVKRLIELKRLRADLEFEIETLQLRLIEEAGSRLKDDGHKTFIGCTYSFPADDGSVARVSFPADALIREFRFNDAGEAFRTRGSGARAEIIELPGLRKLAGEKFEVLFVCMYKPGKAFRELTRSHLGPVCAEKLIDLCTEESSPRVTTEACESVPAVPA